jgi:hypothetical protein
MKTKALAALLGATAILAIPVLTPDAGFGGAAHAQNARGGDANGGDGGRGGRGGRGGDS